MRNQNSGADIHTVGNIRNKCVMLLEVLDDVPTDQAYKICVQLEDDVAKFFMEKYKDVKSH